MNTAAAQNGGCCGPTRQRLNFAPRKGQSDRNSQTCQTRVWWGCHERTFTHAGSVVLRAVKWTLVTGHTRPTSCAATLGTGKESVSGVLGARYHNQFRATCADTQEVKTRIRRIRRNRKMNQFLLLHDNARQHTSLRTTEAITTKQWTVFSHFPYSPGLTPSQFQLFRTLKDAIRGSPLRTTSRNTECVKNPDAAKRVLSIQCLTVSLQWRHCGKIIYILLRMYPLRK